MGVDAEDVDGDGLPELFVTNFANDYNTLYRNLGRDTFLDATANFGLAVDSLPWIGWGCVSGGSRQRRLARYRRGQRRHRRQRSNSAASR